MISLAHDASRFGGRPHRITSGGDRGAARFDIERALAYLDGEDGVEFGEALPSSLDAAGGLRNIGCRPAAVP